MRYLLFAVCVTLTWVIAPQPTRAYQCYTIDVDKSGPCGNSDCSDRCAIAEHQQQAFSDPVLPGFFISATPSGYYIKAVVPSSNAAQSGVQAGDRLLAIDTHTLPLFTSGIWTDLAPHRVVLERDGRKLAVQFAGEPLQMLLSRFTDRRTVFKQVSLQATRSAGYTEYAYVTGILLSRGTQGEIARVLPDSPASEAELKAGDRILTANGEKLAGTNRDRIEGSANRSAIKLVIERSGKAFSVTMRSTSLLALLEQMSLADSERWPQGHAAAKQGSSSGE